MLYLFMYICIKYKNRWNQFMVKSRQQLSLSRYQLGWDIGSGGNVLFLDQGDDYMDVFGLRNGIKLYS